VLKVRCGIVDTSTVCASVITAAGHSAINDSIVLID